MLTEADAHLVVEVARLFVDPVTGQVPTVAVRPWSGQSEAWWQKRCLAEGQIRLSDPTLRGANGGAA